MIPFNLNYLLLKFLSPNIVILGVRALTYEFGRGTIQSITSAITLFSSAHHLPTSDAALLILSRRKVDIGQEMAGVILCS